jgi:hypothetical protein
VAAGIGGLWKHLGATGKTLPAPPEKERNVSNSESGRAASDRVEPPRASWFRRFRANFLSRAVPYYETRRAEKGDPVVIAEAHRRLERKGRLPEDPD